MGKDTTIMIKLCDAYHTASVVTVVLNHNLIMVDKGCGLEHRVLIVTKLFKHYGHTRTTEPVLYTFSIHDDNST